MGIVKWVWEKAKHVGECARRNVGAVVAVIGIGGASAYAIPPAACTALETPATATIGNAITCLVDTVAPASVLVLVVSLFVPVMLMVWGARGGMNLAYSVVRRIFGFMTGRA